MKKASLESINKHLKQATDIAALNKDQVISFTGRKSHSKIRGSNSTQKPIFDRSRKDQSAENLSNRNSFKSKAKEPPIDQGIKLGGLSKIGMNPQLLPQASCAYISSKNKATVNIFNFNNYNIIRHEKEKFSKEHRPDHSIDHSIKSSDNMQNFFIFSRHNRGTLHQKQSRTPTNQGLESIKFELSLRQPDTSGASSNNSRKVKHSKSGSVNLRQGNQSTLFSSSHLHQSFLGRTSVVSLEKAEKACSTTRPSSVCEMNDFLRFVQSQNKLSKWLSSVKVAHKLRKNMTLSLQPLSQRRSSLSTAMTQDPLEKTRDLVCSLISDMRSLEVNNLPEPKPAEKKSVETQTETFIKDNREPVPVSQNYNALIRETAGAFLAQSKRFREGNSDSEQFFRLLASQPWIDHQTLAVFNKSITTLQEHLIFEEALRLLQEKGVVLENIFAFVYDKFGVNGLKEKVEDIADSLILEGELSGASFEENSAGKRADPAQSSAALPDEGKIAICLDFGLLRQDSSELISKKDT